jgi:hypothetical protein
MLRLITSHPRWPDLGLAEDDLRAQLMGPPELELGDAVRAVGIAHARAHGKARWGDKSPGYLVAMPKIQEAVPEARFIHVIRDGRDVALSMAGLSWAPDDAAVVAQRWSRRIGRARDAASSLTAGSYEEVRYESLVTDPEGVLRSLVSTLDLPWSDAMLTYHHDAAERMADTARELRGEKGRVIAAADRGRQHALVRQPPRPDRVGRWRNEMAPADRAAFERVASRMLAERGYEVPGAPTE